MITPRPISCVPRGRAKASEPTWRPASPARSASVTTVITTTPTTAPVKLPTPTHDKHGDGHESQADVEDVSCQDAEELRVERSRKPHNEVAEHECDQAEPHYADARRFRRHLVVA
jgi:hypothetical protein